MQVGTSLIQSNIYSQQLAAANGLLSASKASAGSNSASSYNSTSNESSALTSQAAQPVAYNPSLSQNKTSTQAQSSPESNDKKSSSTVNQVDVELKNQQAAAEAEVKQVINQLKARDSEVRAHEMAHLTVAGKYATGMSFTYQTGPDGRRYAIGGEVGIDTSPVSGDPQATIEKALLIQRAAMAPAEPSAQDRKVAQQAAQMQGSARAELMAQKNDETSLSTESDENRVSENSADSDVNAQVSSIDVSKTIVQSPSNEATLENRFGLSNPEANSDRNQFDLRLKLAV